MKAPLPNFAPQLAATLALLGQSRHFDAPALIDAYLAEREQPDLPAQQLPLLRESDHA